MSSESEARAAIAELDNYSLHGSRIHVEVCVSEWVEWLAAFALLLRLKILIGDDVGNTTGENASVFFPK